MSLSSRWVGFGAALAMAIDYDVISWSVGGWRDDAFTFGAVITAWAMVRFLQRSSWSAAVLMGLCGGLTALVRLTAMTFLVPAFAYLALAASLPFKARLTRILASILVLLVVSAPYLVNCWRAFGHPLYAINHLTADQLVMEAQQIGPPAAAPAGSSMNVVGYLTSKIGGHPYRTLDTVLLGLTSYPSSSIELPLPAADYRLTLRLDPYPRPHDGGDTRLPAVRVFLNNNLLSTFELAWNPERVGSYVARVPRTAIQAGANRLTFMSDPPPDSESGSPRHSFAIWYVRIHPEGALE